MDTSSSNWKPKYIVLGPGGVRGLYILGALHRLKTEGRLTDVIGYSGASVGAMIGLLMNVGYEPMELITMGADTNIFADFFSVQLGERMTDMKENSGIISNLHIRRQLEAAVLAKYSTIPTLMELYRATGIELCVTSYSITNAKTKYISYKTYPNMSCVIAVLLSTNIPLLFYKLTYEGETYIDGGFTAPLPIAPFDDGKSNILTIYIETILNISDEDPAITKLTKYIHKIVMSPLMRLKEHAIASSSSKCRHLALISRAVDTTGSSLSAQDKAEMVMVGIRGAEKLLLNLDRDSIVHEVDGVSMYDRLDRVNERIVFQDNTLRSLEEIIHPSG